MQGTNDALAGSTVVVHVSGDVFMINHGVFLVGVTGDEILWNFEDSALAPLSGSASPVYGTRLAPYPSRSTTRGSADR